jgi:hypothetical protein
MDQRKVAKVHCHRTLEPTRIIAESPTHFKGA